MAANKDGMQCRVGDRLQRNLGDRNNLIWWLIISEMEEVREREEMSVALISGFGYWE